ncbi:MAG: ABC-type nitrate/sulfonate/bicarbonate transport system substrate-binding protein [Dokdonia sp.]|jgi:ABC-type nitrate/sulfonate/bicarbonate transport system substrate-binding protein
MHSILSFKKTLRAKLKLHFMKNYIVIAILIFSFTSCKKETNKVNLTAPKTSFSILTLIADQKGFFESEGLEMNINYVKTGKIALDDLIAGSADFANIVETNIAFAGFLNADIKIFANIEEVYDAGIVARKDKGITKPSDLKGKKLGILLATTSQVFAHRFLEKHGINKDSVQFVNLLPPAMQSAIVEGSGVDAISIWQPYVFNTQKALGEENAIIFNDTEIFTGYMTLAGKSSFSEKNPKTVERMLRAYIKAENFVKNNPNEAKEIVSEFLNLPMPTLNSIWNQYLLKVSLPQSLIDDTTNEAKWITETIEDYKGRKIPNYNSYFDITYLKNVQNQNKQVLEEVEN